MLLRVATFAVKSWPAHSLGTKRENVVMMGGGSQNRCMGSYIWETSKCRYNHRQPLSTLLHILSMLHLVYGILSWAEMVSATWQSPIIDYFIRQLQLLYCHHMWITRYFWVYCSKRNPPDGSKGLAALNAERVTLRGMSEHTMSMRLCMSCRVSAPV